MKKSLLLLVLLIALSLTVAGCGHSPVVNQNQANTITNQVNNTNQPEAQNNGQTVAVSIENFAFNPPTITIKSGTTITWTNNDAAPHLVASNPHPTHTDLPGLQSESLSTGQSYSFTFTQKGTWGYHCHLHPSMKGTIIVE
jgi:amicyanin